MFSAAPLLSNFTAVRRTATLFNISITVVHTGAGLNGTLIVTNIQFRDRESQSFIFFSHTTQVDLRRSSSSPNIWYGGIEIRASGRIGSILQFIVTVQNNLGFETTAETLSSLGMLKFTLLLLLFTGTILRDFTTLYLSLAATKTLSVSVPYHIGSCPLYSSIGMRGLC